jgi:signal transduction histidine kinase
MSERIPVDKRQQERDIGEELRDGRLTIGVLKRFPPIALDGTIVAVLLGLGLLSQLAVPSSGSRANQIAHGVVIAASILPLLLRRRFPFATLLLIAGVIGVTGSIGPPLSLTPGSAGSLALLVATFSAVAFSGARLGWLSLGLALAAITLELRPWVLTSPTIWAPNYPFIVAAFVAGTAQRQRSQLTDVLEARLIDEAAQRERSHRLAVQEARAGLARDLHDVVTRRLGEMTVRAREALDGFRSPGTGPESALAATEAAGRATLSEIRRLLEVLRSDPSTADPDTHAAVRELESPAGTATHEDDGNARRRFSSTLVEAWRRMSRMGWPLDLALVIILSVTAVLEFGPAHQVIEGLEPTGDPWSVWAQGWAVAWIALLLFRRRFPVATALAMAAMAFLQTYPFYFFTPLSDVFALQIAVYTVGSRRPGSLHGWVAAALGAVGLLSVQPLTVAYAAALAVFALTLGGAAYVGTVIGERRRLNAELEARLEALAEERRTKLALAMHEDRLALAREMHDLVAHTITLMVVQAGAARTVAAVDPDAARQATRAVVEAGAEAERELDQLLSLLLAEDAGDPIPPGRRDVEELITQARESGLDVELDRVGAYEPPAGSSIELSAYRIVQESLTNVRKHAPGARVYVHLRFGPDAVGVRVENERSPASARDVARLGAGHGLLGMRERVAIFGGRLQAGPRGSGGFVVDAVMPLEQVAAS